MVKAARKSRQARSVVPNDDNDIEIGDVTARVYPDGVPTDGDGAVANSGQIPVEQARQIGALNAPAAAANRRVAKQLARAANGESVSWNEDDPLQLFENIRQAWPGLAVRVYIKCVDSDETYPPPAMSAFKSSAEFYDYLLKNVHKNKKSTKYEIQFKAAGNSSIRGKGLIVMPDMSEAAQPATVQQQAVFNQFTGRWELPPQPQSVPMPYPPQMYGYPQQPASQAPAQAQQPQQPHIVIHNPMPQMPQQPQVQQPMPQPQMQMDPSAMPPWAQALMQDNQQVRLQLAAALGAAEEYKRNASTSQPVQQIQPPAPQQQPQVQVPPGYTLQPIPGFIPPGFQVPPGYELTPVHQQGLGAPPHQAQAQQVHAPPPPPPPAQVQPGAKSNPLGIDLGAILGALQQVDQVKKAFGIPTGNQPAVEEEDEDVVPTAPLAPPEPDAVKSVSLGADSDSPTYVYNTKDGTPNVMGMVMANLPKLPGFLEKAARAASAVNNAVDDAARQRPIQANVIEQPRRQFVPPPPPQIVEQRQPMSMIPNVPRT